MTGSADFWSKIGQVRPTDHELVAATPTNKVNVRAELVRDPGGAWKVASYVWGFAAGSEP